MSNGDQVPADPISQRAAFWFQMAKFVGWPGVMLVAIFFGFHQIFIWAEPIVERVATAHINVVTGLLEQQKVQNDNQAKSTQILSEIKENQKTQASTIEEHGTILRDIHRAVLPKQSNEFQK